MGPVLLTVGYSTVSKGLGACVRLKLLQLCVRLVCVESFTGTSYCCWAVWLTAVAGACWGGSIRHTLQSIQSLSVAITHGSSALCGVQITSYHASSALGDIHITTNWSVDCIDYSKENLNIHTGSSSFPISLPSLPFLPLVSSHPFPSNPPPVPFSHNLHLVMHRLILMIHNLCNITR